MVRHGFPRDLLPSVCGSVALGASRDTPLQNQTKIEDSFEGISCLYRILPAFGMLAWCSLPSTAMKKNPNGKGCSGGEERALRLHPWLNKPGW